MAAAATKLAGPTAAGPGLKIAAYSVDLVGNYATGGLAIDFSADFTNIYSIVFGGNNASADNNRVFIALLPAPATTVTSSNTLIQAFLGGTTNAILEEEGVESLAAIEQLRILVSGI